MTDSDQPLNRTVTRRISYVVVALCSLFVFSQLQPTLIFLNTTAAGGDMGAHVWAPDYLKNHLLPNLRLTGWTPDWYNGFPALTFYFPLPTVAIALIDILSPIPMNVAFKMVAVSGLVTLPIAVYFFGVRARLPFPGPACLSVASVFFLFDTGYSILGGNVASTLAGEFALSVGLSFAFLFLGVVASGLETNRKQAAAILLLGAVVLSHILATILALVGGVILFALSVIGGEGPLKERVLTRFKWGTIVVTFGCLVSAFWAIPFIWNHQYVNDMGWEKIGTGVESGLKLYDKTIVNYSDALTAGPAWVLLTGFAGAGLALFMRRRMGLFWTLIALAAATAFVLMPQGALWNARILPFWYMSLYMLTALLVAEVGMALTTLAKKDATDEQGSESAAGSAFMGSFARGVAYAVPAAFLVFALMGEARRLPAPVWSPDFASALWYQEGSEVSQNYIPGWAQWNFSGYERKSAYPEYQALLTTMGEIGRTNGCGRAMWEYESELDRFGTPMALMLLPMRTDGCIGSQEGLYFESSSTVPYHFMNQALLSKGPSSAMRNLPYGTLDVADGIGKMQLMGVRYYMAVTPEAVSQADQDSRLTFLRSVPAAAETDETTNQTISREWKIYQVAGSDPVVGLDTLPTVMTDPSSVDSGFKLNSGTQESEVGAWLSNSVSWYGDADADKPLLAADGPESWPRVPNANSELIRNEIVPAQVSNVRQTDHSIEFDVDEIGKPVLVRTSYFPNWDADGADGPYRVTPNLMVVIPTSTHVEMNYGRSLADWLGGLLTLIGLGVAGYFALRNRDRLRRREAETLDVNDVVAKIKERESSAVTSTTAPPADAPSDDTTTPVKKTTGKKGPAKKTAAKTVAEKPVKKTTTAKKPAAKAKKATPEG